MKKFLLIIITVILIRPIIPIMDYLIDYEYISTVLCINKDKPELECNGKCYLMQELAKVAEEQSNEMAKKLCSLSFSFMYFITHTSPVEFTVIVTDVKQVIHYHPFLKVESFSSSLFRPPLIA